MRIAERSSNVDGQSEVGEIEDSPESSMSASSQFRCTRRCARNLVSPRSLETISVRFSLRSAQLGT